MSFLTVMSNKPTLFNYKCAPSGLWLKGIDNSDNNNNSHYLLIIYQTSRPLVSNLCINLILSQL